ncbi:CAP domain-containing protein [Devosia sp.]|uniref:CAP domain-containing protein n=1 Tax=Devosia sp. TaxID=1871048 RepID=UPI003A904D56
MSLSRRAFVVLGIAAFTAACSPIGPQPGVSTPPAALTQARIVSAINGVRKANGRKPLTYNSRLEAAARTQANLMASKDQLSHNLGKTLRERVREQGYEGAVGENVAGGHKTLEQAIQGWLDSPGHRAALLSPNFEEFGLAVANVAPGRKSRYGIYWSFIAGGPFDPWIKK